MKIRGRQRQRERPRRRTQKLVLMAVSNEAIDDIPHAHRWQVHPRAHGVDDSLVSVAAAVDAISRSIVASRVRLVGRDIAQAANALVAERASAQVAVRQAVRDTICLLAVVKVERGEHHSNRVIIVVVRHAKWILEELDFELAMQINIAIDHQNGSVAAHITRGTSRLLLICVVILDCQAIHGHHAAVDIGFLRIRAVPDLEHADLIVSEARVLECSDQVGAVVVPRIGVAEKHLSLSAEQHFHPHNEIWRKVPTKVDFQLGVDGHNVVWLDVLCCIHADAREPNSQEISDVIRESLLYFGAFCVEVNQTCEPAGIEVKGIGPRIERALAVEVDRAPRHRRELLLRRQPGVPVWLVHIPLGVEWRGRVESARILLGEIVAVVVAVVGIAVISAANHVVHDCVSINANVLAAASLDHLAQRLSTAHPPLQPVAHRLIHEIPGIFDRLERPGAHHLLLRRVNLCTHVASLSQESALLLDLVVWPAKELDNSALLSVAVVAAGEIDDRVCPQKVDRIENQRAAVNTSNSHIKRVGELRVSIGLIGRVVRDIGGRIDPVVGE
eukprot:m.291164 g.291164  ORF g.291164 m.291164 type:complete len:558 (-) comp55093_c0_seq1:1029-2702(-)